MTGRRESLPILRLCGDSRHFPRERRRVVDQVQRAVGVRRGPGLDVRRPLAAESTLAAWASRSQGDTPVERIIKTLPPWSDREIYEAVQ